MAIEPDISGGPDGAGGHLLVVPPGESQVGPPQLDTYARLQQLLAKLGSEHDLVIVDCAPLLAGVYALPLYAQADAALVVVRLRDTSRDDLGATANELLANDIPVLGVVLESA